MNVHHEKAPVALCGIVHGSFTALMAVTGGVAAYLLTVATVSAVFSAVALFAAPAIVLGVISTTVFACCPEFLHANPGANFALHAIGFALLCAATIAVGLAIGILSPLLVMPFALAAAVGALLWMGIAITSDAHSPHRQLLKSEV